MAETLICKNGICVPVPPGTAYIPELTQACIGKKEGDPCSPEPPEPLKKVACIDGTCQETDANVTQAQIKACVGVGVGNPCEMTLSCKEECQQKYPIGTQQYADCIAACKGEPGDNPCKAGGQLGKQVKDAKGKWRLIKPCEDGYVAKRAEDGRIWCCKKVAGGCQSDADCGEGEKCINGKCEGGDEECEGGYKLSDQPLGGSCQGSIYTDDVIKAEHGWKRDPRAVGHYLCNPKYGYQKMSDVKAFIRGEGSLSEGAQSCKKGYPPKTINGETWCCPGAGGGGGGNGGGGEEFQWGEDLQGLIARIMERANYLLDYPRGLTPEERQTVINYAIEGVKAGERGAIRSKQEQLARMGLAGSGIELAETEKIQRGTREAQADVRRELAIDDLNRRFQEIMGTTGAVQGLGGFLMQSEQIPEVLSAARRQEGFGTIQALLNYLGQMQSGQGGYWQAILSQLMGGGSSGGSGGLMDWLPWLTYLIGGSGRTAI